jgi:uncharacterized protein (DUF488 family)
MRITVDGTTIYTIGHSNLNAEDVVAALRRHGVAGVVDVRSVPFSQYTPQFNRDAFERMLTEAGIAYNYAGDHLGGRPTDPTCYRDGVVPDGPANYLALVDYDAVARRPWYRQALERLIELAAGQPTAIMCSEEDPARCHRQHLIAQSLLERGLDVRHIRKLGGVEPAMFEPKQLSLLP